MSDDVMDTMWTTLDPVVEGFAIEMAAPGQKQKLRRVIAQELGKDWQVRPFGAAGTDFEVTAMKTGMRVDQAWQAAYRLRVQPGVIYAEPLFAAAVSNRPDWNQMPNTVDLMHGGRPTEPVEFESALSNLCFESGPLPGSADPEWSLQEIRAFEAWQRFFSNQAHMPGDGIIVGHPDTGYTQHPEIASNLSDDGYDFVQNDEDARDELLQGGLLNPGHGTATASVIVSPRGVPGANTAARGVTGVAPGAKLIPIRVSPSVVLLSTLNLARAIEYAVRRGVHVISISMGGVFSWRLRKAIVFAQKQGVIVLAAAGNCVRFVVWPAAYDEVVAVAASNANHETWRGSSRGRAVDVTAPGESVWRADVDPGAVPDIFTVGRGSGTSYAVAVVAGVAALWLARHGRAQLIQRYGAEKIPFIFNQILRNTCTPMAGPTWTPGDFGAGLVNAEAVLDAPLPDGNSRPIPAPGLFFEAHAGVDEGGVATFAHLFEQSLRPARPGEFVREGARPQRALRPLLAELLRTSEAELPSRLKEVGQELAFHFAVTPQLHRQFEAALAGPHSDIAGETTAAGVRHYLEAIRANLVLSGVSPALRAQLATAAPVAGSW